MADFQIRSSGGPVGAEITGIDVSRPIDDATFAEIAAALDRYSVVVLRGQALTGAQMADFSRRFGTPQVNSDEAPEVFWVSNVPRTASPSGRMTPAGTGISICATWNGRAA